MSSHLFEKRCMTRREMLSLCRNGFGAVALLSMAGSIPFGNRLLATPSPGVPGVSQIPHFRPRATSIIFLYMDGGVSQVDAFDPKPRLDREHGENPRDKFSVDATQFNQFGTLMKSHWEFKQHGESGMWMSDLFPNIATCVDDIAMINSMVSDFPEHTNANYFLHTGVGIQGRPSIGAWINYGLGSENENLPGYVVLDGGLIPPGGVDNFKNGFLPGVYQASIMRAENIPLPNILPNEESTASQRAKLERIEEMDRSLLGKLKNADQIESAITNYELAYKMQSSVPELTDFTAESRTTQHMYGLFSDDEHTRSYGAQCLMARRLVERGVRFIELTCPKVKADRWDQHQNLKDGHTRNAHAVDKPVAALIKDLKQRGLLDSTLVVFAGEFGRTPFAQGNEGGRDHNPQAFSIWMAGGGVKGGTVYGKTDEYGYRVVENPVTIHELHATMLYLLGIDHEKQTYRFGGRDIRLTDVHGRVIHEIIG